MTSTTAVDLESHLTARRAAGAKLLVPYVTAGVIDGWLDLVEALVGAGADAIEIGIPFSDPSIDGPTIQEASARAIDRGTNPPAVIAALAERRIEIPLIAMTYYNFAFRAGERRFASELARAGISGAIFPDLPMDLADDWRREANAVGIANVLLVAPVTSDHRLRAITARTQGFLYSVSTMGTTGEREELATTAAALAARAKALTTKPVLIGFGISQPHHAVTAAAASDGVIVASALMRRILDGADIDDAVAFISTMRVALDEAAP